MPKTNRKPGIHLHKSEWKSVTDGRPCEYYWILIAKNGKTIAKSSETYKRKHNAVKSMAITSDIFKTYFQYYDHSEKEVELFVY